MKVKCFQCKEIIESSQAIWHGYDGDYMCDEMCVSRFNQEMAKVNSMTDEQFEGYMGMAGGKILTHTKNQ